MHVLGESKKLSGGPPPQEFIEPCLDPETCRRSGPGQSMLLLRDRRVAGFLFLLAVIFLNRICGFRIAMAVSTSLGGFWQNGISPGVSSVLDVFQVYKPVPSSESTGEGGCNLDLLLMRHDFGFSYGHPFVGTWEEALRAIEMC